jgi:hypothetical protein
MDQIDTYRLASDLASSATGGNELVEMAKEIQSTIYEQIIAELPGRITERLRSTLNRNVEDALYSVSRRSETYKQAVEDAVEEHILPVVKEYFPSLRLTPNDKKSIRDNYRDCYRDKIAKLVRDQAEEDARRDIAKVLDGTYLTPEEAAERTAAMIEEVKAGTKPAEEEEVTNVS